MWALVYIRDKFEHKVLQDDICKAVTKVDGGHPGPSVISKIEATSARYPSWYPGKTSDDGVAPGPKAVFTAQKTTGSCQRCHGYQQGRIRAYSCSRERPVPVRYLRFPTASRFRCLASGSIEKVTTLVLIKHCLAASHP